MSVWLLDKGCSGIMLGGCTSAMPLVDVIVAARVAHGVMNVGVEHLGGDNALCGRAHVGRHAPRSCLSSALLT